MIELQAVAHRFWLVIRPPNKGLAVLIADAGLPGRLPRHVIRRLTRRADEPAREPLDENIVGHFQVDNHVQQLGKCLGLSRVPREAVEYIPSGRIWLCQPSRDPEENVIIRYKVPSRDLSLNFAAKGSASRDLVPDDVSGSDMGNTERFG